MAKTSTRTLVAPHAVEADAASNGPAVVVTRTALARRDSRSPRTARLWWIPNRKPASWRRIHRSPSSSHRRTATICSGYALRSVQLQRFENWECVVVDDGSLDNAVPVAQAFAEVDQRFRVLVHAECRGLSAARNTGIAEATAPYIVFLDDDDLLMPGTIESRLLAVAGMPADVAGSYSDWMTIDFDRGLEVLTSAPKATPRTNISFSDLASGTPFTASSPMVRTEVVRSVGGFDETLVRAEDADLWSRIMRRGFRFVFAGDVGVAYRRTPGSLSLGNPDAQLDSDFAGAPP